MKIIVTLRAYPNNPAARNAMSAQAKCCHRAGHLLVAVVHAIGAGHNHFPVSHFTEHHLSHPGASHCR